MRQIILDTETTGLEPKLGHRIIEIGCIELVNRKPTTRNFHYYLNPEREIDAGALAVHGLSQSFLQDKPLFSAIADEFLQFIKGAELIIHNASFDISFIEAELQRLPGYCATVTEFCTVVDTLGMARKKFPGQKNSLDALCKRFEIDNSNRTLHGALLDAQLLAEVYLRLTGGQRIFSFEENSIDTQLRNDSSLQTPGQINKIYDIPVITANTEEIQLHNVLLNLLSKRNSDGQKW